MLYPAVIPAHRPPNKSPCPKRDKNWQCSHMVWGDSLTGSAWPMCVKPTFEVLETACKTLDTFMHTCTRVYVASFCSLTTGFTARWASLLVVRWLPQHPSHVLVHIPLWEVGVSSWECLHSVYHIREKTDTTSRRLLPFLHTQQAWGRHCQTTVPCIKPYVPCIKTWGLQVRI